jgi:beta-phosphoglucomutase
MKNCKGLIFDLNGTMINDMHFHSKVWFKILQDLGANLTTEEVNRQMYGKNEELLERVFGKGYFTLEQMKEISHKKEVMYQEMYLPHLKLIEGLDAFLTIMAKQNKTMSIGSAAIPFNISFVLDNLNIRHYFKTIVSADDVVTSKPHPEVFLKAASLMRTDPADCIVFEDSPKGVEAAQNAGMCSIVITSMHGKADFQNYSNVLGYIKDYDDPVLKEIIAWL